VRLKGGWLGRWRIARGRFNCLTGPRVERRIWGTEKLWAVLAFVRVCRISVPEGRKRYDENHAWVKTFGGVCAAELSRGAGVGILRRGRTRAGGGGVREAIRDRNFRVLVAFFGTGNSVFSPFFLFSFVLS